jgi:putative ABC transport system permease protein
MRVTTRKTLRDIRRQRAQFGAVGLTVLLGVALFVASAGAFLNLSDSYQFTYDRLHFADVVATGGDPDIQADAARSTGARAVVERTQADPPMLIEGTKLVGRVIGLPVGGQPAVDAVDVTRGGYLSPDDPDGVLLERHAADTFALEVGDTLQVYTTGGWHTVTVRGIAASAEYIWPARNRQEVLSDPHAFAVVFAAEQAVRQWTGAGPNQVLVELPAGDSPGEMVAALHAAGASDVTLQAEQPSHATLQEDLDGFSELAVAFPLLFLTAAAVAAYVLLARRVLAERPIIGALMASGARRGRLVRHYLHQGLLVGLFGGTVGVLLGVLATGIVTRSYTDALGIPDTVVSQHPDLALAGLAFGAVVGLAGALAPAVTAARTMPAEAMRNTVVSRPPGGWSRFVARLRAIPVTSRMALRDVFRSRRRTLATMLGVVLALILVLASAGMLTSMSAAMRLQFDQIQRQDATVAVAANAIADPAAELRQVSGVAAVEPARTGQVTATHGQDTYTTVLTGFVPGTDMHRFRSDTGEWVALPDSGVLAGAALVDELQVAVGDTLTLSTPDGAVRVRLAGLLGEPMGTSIYTTIQTAAQVIPDASVQTYLVRFDGGADRDAMRRTITALPGVVTYADADSLLGAIAQYLSLFWAFIGIMVLLGGVLAFAVIYVTMAVNVVERTNELATLRAAGVSVRRVSGMLAAENLAATALGVPFGLILGVLAGRGFLASFNSDLFQFEADFTWWVLAISTLGVLLAAAASQWPAVRAVRRLDVARVVRERAA